MSLGLLERAKQANVLRDLDLKQYLNREEMNRVVPAESLAEEGKRLMLVGAEHEGGLLLPWHKAQGKVLIKAGKLCIWTGWQHHGKSGMLKHVMVDAMKQSERVCIASMEEELRELWCDMGRLAVGADDPRAEEIDGWTEFCKSRLWFYDQQGRVKPETAIALIRYCAEELKITQVVIDSLMMVQIARDEYDKQAGFVADLKAVAKDTGTTVHLVAHMRKRDGKTGEENPGGAHDISGPHDLASMADYIFNVWRDKENKNAHGYPALLKVEKQRGRVNWIGTLGLGFDAKSRQFTDGGIIRYVKSTREREYHSIANYYGEQND